MKVRAIKKTGAGLEPIASRFVPLYQNLLKCYGFIRHGFDSIHVHINSSRYHLLLHQYKPPTSHLILHVSFSALHFPLFPPSHSDKYSHNKIRFISITTGYVMKLTVTHIIPGLRPSLPLVLRCSRVEPKNECKKYQNKCHSISTQ